MTAAKSSAAPTSDLRRNFGQPRTYPGVKPALQPFRRHGDGNACSAKCGGLGVGATAARGADAAGLYMDGSDSREAIRHARPAGSTAPGASTSIGDGPTRGDAGAGACGAGTARHGSDAALCHGRRRPMGHVMRSACGDVAGFAHGVPHCARRCQQARHAASRDLPPSSPRTRAVICGSPIAGAGTARCGDETARAMLGTRHRDATHPRERPGDRLHLRPPLYETFSADSELERLAAASRCVSPA